MSNILIKANNISKVYDQDLFLKRGANFYALKNVDFILEEGDFISVMGPSGSGKSTLLNCLSSLDTVSSGAISILNRYVGEMNDTLLSDYRNRYLGFIFQNHNLISSLTMYDNIATQLILNHVDPKEIQKKVIEISQKLGIEHILYKKPNECSGGERQRASVARAIVTNPRILFCDEPTGNLDSKNSHEILEILKELNNHGTSIVIVTHDNMIASYAKRFYYLRDGEIIKKVIRHDASQVDFFNEIVKITTQDSLLKIFSDSNSAKTPTEEVIDKVEESPIIEEEKIVAKKHKTIRSIVYAVFANQEYDESQYRRRRLLNFEDDLISFTLQSDATEIRYEDVERIKISMCSRSERGFPFPEFHFYLDLDIITKTKETYKFELVNQKNAAYLFTCLSNHQIAVDDPYGIIELYQQHPNWMERQHYFEANFRKLAKKHDLDNPRGL